MPLERLSCFRTFAPTRNGFGSGGPCDVTGFAPATWARGRQVAQASRLQPSGIGCQPMFLRGDAADSKQAGTPALPSARKQRTIGFTLMELLTAIAVIAILTAIGIGAVR